MRWEGSECSNAVGTLELSGWKSASNELTFIKRSACAEYARRTILGSEDERGRIRGRIVKYCFVVV
jgi:hypothetical protein